MTARPGNPGDQAQLDGYEGLISRLRAAVPSLPTSRLVRIRAALEQALAAEPPSAETLAELARALDGEA